MGPDIGLDGAGGPDGVGAVGLSGAQFPIWYAGTPAPIWSPTQIGVSLDRNG